MTYKAIYKRTEKLKDTEYPMFCQSTENWVCRFPSRARQLAEYDCPQGYEIYKISIVI